MPQPENCRAANSHAETSQTAAIGPVKPNWDVPLPFLTARHFVFMLFLALIYAVGFWVVAFKRPFVALVLIWALTPLQTNIGAGVARFSLTELHLLLVMPLLLLQLRQSSGRQSSLRQSSLQQSNSRSSRAASGLGPLSLPIGAYLFVCLLATILHPRGSDAVFSMAQMVLYIVLTVLIFSTLISPRELQRVPYSLIMTGALWSIIGIATKFSFLGHLKNAFGASLAAASLVAFDFWLAEPKGARRNWILAGGLIILMGLMLSLSRGGWIGAFFGMLMIVALRRAWKTLALAVVVAIPLGFVTWNLLPARQQNYALSFDVNRFNIRARYIALGKAQRSFADDPVLGSGIGLRKQMDAINLVWMTLAESGILGALALGWVFAAFYALVWRTQRQMSPRDPGFSLLSIGAALMTCKLMHGMVDHYWTRGAITLAWGGAGMVLVASRLPQMRAAEIALWMALQPQIPAAPRRPALHAYAPGLLEPPVTSTASASDDPARF